MKLSQANKASKDNEQDFTDCLDDIKIVVATEIDFEEINRRYDEIIE
jgi:hypothetical protein